MNLQKATEKAIKASEHSDMKFHIGAVIFNKHRYTSGFNRAFNYTLLSHPRQFSIHAEEMCIIKALRRGFDLSTCDLSTYNIVIVRVNRNGDLRPITPCKDCQRLINLVKLRKVYYVDENFKEM